MEEYIRKKITQLRLSKKLSEYQLSYQLGHSKSYINNISSGKTLPSMKEFLFICDFFEITPEEFFSSGKSNPNLINNAILELKKLNDEDLMLVISLLQKINNK